MCPLSLRLPPPRFTQDFDMPNGLSDGCLEVKKIDGLGQEIKSPPIHCGANIGRVAIG